MLRLGGLDFGIDLGSTHWMGLGVKLCVPTIQRIGCPSMLRIFGSQNLAWILTNGVPHIRYSRSFLIDRVGQSLSNIYFT